MRSIKPGNMRSDSARPRPQVGSDGQAIAAACKTLGLVFRLYSVRLEQCSDRGLVSFAAIVGENHILVWR